MAQTPNVHSGAGSWVEYSRHYFLQRIWTLPTNGAGILTNFVAVVLTLATSLLFILCQHMIQLYWSESPVGAQQETQPVLNGTIVVPESEDNTNTGGLTRTQDLRLEYGSRNLNGSTNHPGGIESGVQSTIANAPRESDETTITTDANGSNAQRTESEGNPNERDSLLNSPFERRNKVRSKMDILMSRETVQAVSFQYLKSAWKEFKSGPETSIFEHIKLGSTWKKFSIRFCLSIICLAAFICFTIATIYVAQLTSDGISLSAAPNCGIWELDSSLDVLSPFSYMQEMESGDYARRCYDASSGADGCNYFFTQNIEYHEKNDTCPFASGFCLGGDLPAYTLSTGLVKSQDIGINVPIGYTFKRNSTCAPIQRDDYYSVNDDNFIEYYYGELFSWMDQGNLTWTAFPNYPVWTGPGYNVETFCRVAANGPWGWQPIPEFMPETNNFITLMLVASQRIYHPEYRADPIFPAEELHFIGGEFFWMNNDLVATVLACTDHTSICTAAGDICWDIHDNPVEELHDPVEKNGLYMLQIALQKSSICHSLLLRGGDALDASTKLFVYNSLPLAAEQWKVEAENLFAASLARITIALRDHVRGSAAKEPGYVNLLTPEHAGMCDQYKFKSVGWANVSVWGFVAAMIGSLVVFVLAFKVEIPIPAGEDVQDGEAQEMVKNDRLVIEILGLRIRRSWHQLRGWIERGVKWTKAK